MKKNPNKPQRDKYSDSTALKMTDQPGIYMVRELYPVC